MKKIFAGIATMGLALVVCGITAFAAEPGRGRCFTDTDNDGICDNAGSKCIYADSDGDGVCDFCGTNSFGCLTGDGAFFADADGDGICDNCSTYHLCGMAGAVRNFVDADGDGVCDNKVSGQCQGGGYGRGCGGRGNGFRGGRGR